MGVDGGAQERAACGGAGLEGEGEDKRVERERGVNDVEEREGLLVAALVYVRGQELCIRKQTKEVRRVGIHG